MVSGFPVPSRDVTARESLVSDIQAGDWKTANLFLQCGTAELFITSVNVKNLIVVNIFRDFQKLLWTLAQGETNS